MSKYLSFKIILSIVTILLITGLMAITAKTQTISGNVVDTTGRNFVQNGCVNVAAFIVDANGVSQHWREVRVDGKGNYSIGVHFDTWHVVVNVHCEGGYYGSTITGHYEYIVTVMVNIDYPGYNFAILADPTPPVISDVQVLTPAPKAGEDIKISARIEDDRSGIRQVGIHIHPVDAPPGWWGYWWGRMYDADGDGIYEGIIGRQLVHQAGLQYWIEVENFAHLWVSSPPERESNPYEITGIAPSDATISGIVTDDSGNSLQWVEVYAYRTTGDGGEARAWTDANGNFKLEVQAGTWCINYVFLCSYLVTWPEMIGGCYYEVTVNVGDHPDRHDFVMTSETTPPTFDHAPYYVPVVAGNELTLRVRVQDSVPGVCPVWVNWRCSDWGPGQWNWGWGMGRVEGDQYNGVYEIRFGVDYGRVVEYGFMAQDCVCNQSTNPAPPPWEGGKPYRTVILRGSSLWMDFYGRVLGCGTIGQIGDVILAKDGDNNIVGGYIVDKAGEYGFMHVYQDDPSTGEDEGVDPGEEIYFYINDVKAFTEEPVTYTKDKDQVELNLTVVEEFKAPLKRGWNLFSFATVPPDKSVEYVLSSIWGQFEVVRGYECAVSASTKNPKGASTFVPGMELFNDLTEMSEKRGYWIKMNNDATLRVSGVPYKDGATGECEPMADTEIDMCAGWNLISYLAKNTLTPDSALAPITPKECGKWMLVRGYDQGGKTYSFDPGLMKYNDLKEMKRGFGYWVWSCVGGNFDYPTGNTSGFEPTVAAPPLSDGNVLSTPTNVDFYGSLTIDGKPAPVGTVVQAFDPQGMLCGKFTVKHAGTFGFAHVYGDDEMTPYKDEGARQGDVITFYVNGELAVADRLPIWTRDGDRTELNLEVKKQRVIPKVSILYQNYPNPFNPETWMPYQLSEGADVTIQIYSSTGQLVRTLDFGKREAGIYLNKESAAYWDGKNDTGERISSGVYFYSIHAGKFSATKKLVILK
ncbi:T9SS type A sorting domain-containing protein [Candidatus Poribacteria bacterium]|nr:T9SS type A sorting domain-containing protein [Candidatus Poribacteria bacterium]